VIIRPTRFETGAKAHCFWMPHHIRIAAYGCPIADCT
jgi:hypothetical protein